MTTPSEPRTPRLYHVPRAAAFPPIDALGGTALAMTAFILASGTVAAATGEAGLVAIAAGELMFLLVPVLMMLGTRRPPVVLGLTRPARLDVLAAVLVGSSLWYINLWLVALLQLPTTSVQPLQQLVEAPSLPVALLFIAVVPAICEELTFRGLLARSLATRLSPVWAIGIQAAVFSAYHLSVAQLIPTFVLGFVLGALALRAGSTVPAMIGHLVNNTVALLIAREDLAGVSEWVDDYPVGALGIAIPLAAAGIALIVRGPAPGARSNVRT